MWSSPSHLLSSVGISFLLNTSQSQIYTALHLTFTFPCDVDATGLLLCLLLSIYLAYYRCCCAPLPRPLSLRFAGCRHAVLQRQQLALHFCQALLRGLALHTHRQAEWCFFLGGGGK